MTVIVLERQSWPGLLTAISNDPWSRRGITCQTSFPPGTQLHDYTGRHGDIWTDARGQASFVVPSNAFGSGQSYLCFSRTGQGEAPAPHGHPTQQSFFGAPDLDIPGLGNGKTVTLPRIYLAVHSRLRAELELDRRAWTNATAVTLDLTDPAGGVVTRHHWNSSSGSAFDVNVGAGGWYTLRLSAAGMVTAQPFELAITYTAPQTL